MTDARNDNEEEKAKRKFARVIEEFLTSENEFVKNMQTTTAALSSESAVDKKHLRAGAAGRKNLQGLIDTFQQQIGNLKEADFLQANNANVEAVVALTDIALDPAAFDQHLKALTELTLQSIAVNGRNDAFNSKINASIVDTKNKAITAFQKSNPQTEMSMDDFNRISATAGSKELLYASERNTFVNPMQRMGKYPLLFREILDTFDNISDNPENKDVKAGFREMAESSEKHMTFLNRSKEIYLRLSELQEANPANAAKFEKMKGEIFKLIPDVDGLARVKLFVDLHEYLENKGSHRKEAAKIIDIVLNNDSLELIFGEIKLMGELGSTGRLHALVSDFMKAAKTNIDASYEHSAKSDAASSDSEATQADEPSFDEDYVIPHEESAPDDIDELIALHDDSKGPPKEITEAELDELIKIAEEALPKPAAANKTPDEAPPKPAAVKNAAMDDLKAGLTKYLNEKQHPTNHKKIADELRAMIVKGEPADKIILRALEAKNDLAEHSKLKRMVFRSAGGTLDTMLSNYIQSQPQSVNEKIRFMGLLDQLQTLNIKAGHTPENSTLFINMKKDFINSMSDPQAQVSIPGQQLYLLNYFTRQFSEHIEQNLGKKEANFMKAVITKLMDYPVSSEIDPKVKVKLDAAMQKANEIISPRPEPEEPINRGPRAR